MLSRLRFDLGWTKHGKVFSSSLYDVGELDEVLRPEDRRELEDSSGLSARECLYRFVLMGDPAVTLRTHEGDMIGMLAAVPVSANVASIGMAGSELIAQRAPSFLRGSREALRHLHQRYDGLICTADARNSVHLNWLEWLGFTATRRVFGYGAGGIEGVEFASIKRS